MADKPKLTATGQALQSALDLIGQGGDKASIVAQIDQQIIAANASGDQATAEALKMVAFNYANYDQFADSSTQGIAYLRQVQGDIAQGKYNDTTAVAPSPAAPAPAPVQSPTDIAQDRLAQAVQGGNPQAIQKAEQDLHQAEYDAVHSQTSTTTTTASTTSLSTRPVPAMSTSDALVATQWPQVIALKQTLEALDGATVTVKTVQNTDEQIRRYRAR